MTDNKQPSRLKRLVLFWWAPSLLLWTWIGSYVFDHRFPVGWQHEWYGTPTMVTFAMILGLHVLGSVAWAKTMDRARKTT